MPSEWKHISLRDAGVTLIDCDHRTPPAVDSGYPYVSIPQLRQGRIEMNDARKITAEHFEEWTRKAKPQAYDVVLSRRCNPGETAFVAPHMEFALGQNLVLLRADGSKVYPPFLRWLVRSPDWWDEVERFINVGAIFNSLKCTDIPKFLLPIPALSEQKSIAETLGVLDDKIALLRETNATLEAIAQALFKSWFVDFDPVRAKAEGREPEGVPPEVADMFPSEFENSELGEIPKGWRVGDVYEVASVRYGAPFASKLFNTNDDGLPLIRIRDLKDEAPGVWTPEVHPKGYRLQPGDIVVGMDGEFRAHLWGGEEAWMNQRICVFHPCNGHSAVFVRNVIAAPLAHVEATETATTVIHLGKGDIDRFRVIVPPPAIAKTFANLCQPLYDQIVSGKQRARAFAATRDTLLPRLMSGKLRIPELQEAIEEATA